MRKCIFIALCAVVFASCGIYKKYQTPEVSTDHLVGDSIPADSITAQLPQVQADSISWRDFFTDPLLQNLIDSALARNTDMRSAQLTLDKAQASLKAAKLAYLPSLSLNPQASISTTVGTDGSTSGLSHSYNIPLQLDWNIGISGSVTVNKRKAQSIKEQAEAQRDAMQANLISTVAQLYYELLLLDRQLEILLSTDSLWDISLETEKALWENGQAYSTAVNQMESSNLSVKMQIIETRRSILSIENSMCKVLRITPRPIERGTWDELQLAPFNFELSATALLNRPDVRLADKSLAEAFYNTAAARAAFFPSFSLQGILGWTNNGGVIADPGALLLQLLASLTQPIFAQGKLRAALKIAKYGQEDQLNQYVQTIINAGNQVNECLADCNVARDKDILYQRQLEVLQDAYDGTHTLMHNGKASYLEVLTAQESLLSAQLDAAENKYNAAISLISLYIALGGATK